jgi:hypothetical protein
MMRFIYIILPIIFHLQATSKGTEKETTADSGTTQGKDMMKLKITIGTKTATAVLYDNQTSRDFASLLPLSLTLTDYNNTEKIGDLSKKLDTKGAPAGFAPTTGDIAYYAPWGNLAIFYKDFGYSNGLVSLGKITGGAGAFNIGGPIPVKIELE